MSYKGEFIEFMVDSGVLIFGDFTTKSGRKTPYFVNTGNYKTAMQITKLGEYYAKLLVENDKIKDVDFLFGPAYKGIPLVITTAVALYNNYGIDIPYCFNRKEAKDHGEGGSLVGYKPKSGDRCAIIEDVTTAGTSIRESLAILNPLGVKVTDLAVSINRMEKGTGEYSALYEINQNYGIDAYPIVTVYDVIDHLYNKEYKGKILIDEDIKLRLDEYLKQYGAKA